MCIGLSCEKAMGKGFSLAIFWQLCVKMSIMGMGLKCMLKLTVLLGYVEGM